MTNYPHGYPKSLRTSVDSSGVGPLLLLGGLASALAAAAIYYAIAGIAIGLAYPVYWVMLHLGRTGSEGAMDALTVSWVFRFVGSVALLRVTWRWAGRTRQAGLCGPIRKVFATFAYLFFALMALMVLANAVGWGDKWSSEHLFGTAVTLGPGYRTSAQVIGEVFYALWQWVTIIGVTACLYRWRIPKQPVVVGPTNADFASGGDPSIILETAAGSVAVNGALVALQEFRWVSLTPRVYGRLESSAQPSYIAEWCRIYESFIRGIAKRLKGSHLGADHILYLKRLNSALLVSLEVLNDGRARQIRAQHIESFSVEGRASLDRHAEILNYLAATGVKPVDRGSTGTRRPFRR